MSEEAATEGAPVEGAAAVEGNQVEGSAAAAETDPFDNTEVQQFDRAYVEKLRKEAADRRGELTPYKEAFGGYDPEEQQIWFDLARTMQEDPEKAAEAMDMIVQAIRTQNISEVGTPTKEKEAGESKAEFLTQEDLDKAFTAREQKLALDREIQNLNAEVAELGYKPGTPEYNDLMWRAANQHGHDVQAAHKARAAEFEGAITKYLEDKAKDASGSPRVVSTTGAPAGEGAKISSFADARAAVEARLEAALRGE